MPRPIPAAAMRFPQLRQVHGLVCPMVTPFDTAGQVDHRAARQIVDFLLAHGVQVLFPAGSTGEGALMSVAERKALAETVLDQTAGRVPVIVHTGCATTAETIELTAHARAAGATAASVITPYFFPYDDDSLFAHYQAVARAAPDFPIFVYVFPGNARNDVSTALLERLRTALPNLAGIKSSNPDLARFRAYVETGGQDFVALCGVDALMLDGLRAGSWGQVSGNANAAPELFRALYDAFQTGAVDAAQAQQARIDRLRAVLHDGLHPAFFKAALTLRGVPGGSVRAPMRELTDTERAKLEQAFAAVGLP